MGIVTGRISSVRLQILQPVLVSTFDNWFSFYQQCLRWLLRELPKKLLSCILIGLVYKPDFYPNLAVHSGATWRIHKWDNPAFRRDRQPPERIIRSFLGYYGYHGDYGVCISVLWRFFTHSDQLAQTHPSRLARQILMCLLRRFKSSLHSSCGLVFIYRRVVLIHCRAFNLYMRHIYTAWSSRIYWWLLQTRRTLALATDLRSVFQAVYRQVLLKFSHELD